MPDVSVIASLDNISLQVNKTPVTWNDFVGKYGRGYNFPIPTGQTISYRAGDDANIESTVFGATVRNAETLKARNTLASFLVLNNNNAFGNTNRFTDDAGGQTYANDYVIDHYTGLGWYRLLQTTATWNDAIDAALASAQGGHAGWSMCNVTQWESVLLYEGTANDYMNYAPFNLVHGESFLSTTRDPTITQAITGSILGRLSTESKVNSLPYLICRKHY